MGVGGPEGVEIRELAAGFLPVSREGDVVDEGVEPDVGDEVRIEGNLDAPVQTFLGPGNAEVGVGGPVNGVENLGATESREDAEGAGLDGRTEPFGVLGKFEIPVFLLEFDDLSPFRSELALLVAVLFGEVLFLADRVEPTVGFLAELAFVVQVYSFRYNNCCR